MKKKHLIGPLSGKEIVFPEVNRAPMPLLNPPGVVKDGKGVDGFGTIGNGHGYADVRSHRRKFGLLIPITNTSMEHEIWSIIFNNPSLDGVGVHTTNVLTPKSKLENEADLKAYKTQFLGGLEAAVDQAQLAEPEYLIMGMSLEHIIAGLDGIKASMGDIESYSKPAWSTWHDAAFAAVNKFNARRIGLISPFDRQGNENAAKMFEDMGFEVVSTVGFSCADALHIAHIPDWAKEKAVLELLATEENNLDAVVQCGTNMSFLNVTEKLEPTIGIPILGINAVTFWHALRETGFASPLVGAGRLAREY